MSDTVLIALITSLPSLLTALATLVTVWRGQRTLLHHVRQCDERMSEVLVALGTRPHTPTITFPARGGPPYHRPGNEGGDK